MNYSDIVLACGALCVNDAATNIGTLSVDVSRLSKDGVPEKRALDKYFDAAPSMPGTNDGCIG